MNPPDSRACILISRCCNGARVEHNDFSFRGSFSGLEPELQKLALNGGPIGLGGPTTEVLYIECAHRTIVAVLDFWSGTLVRTIFQLPSEEVHLETTNSPG